MKKLLTILTTAALAAVSLTPLAASSVYTEMSNDSIDLYIRERYGDEAILLEKGKWNNTCDRAYYIYHGNGEAEVVEINKNKDTITIDFANGVNTQDISSILDDFNAENGTDIFIIETSFIGYKGELSPKVVKDLSKLLREKELITSFEYTTNRANLTFCYTTDTMTGYEAEFVSVDNIERCIEENDLDCEIKHMIRYDREWLDYNAENVIPEYSKIGKEVYFVVPNNELTAMEYFDLMCLFREYGCRSIWVSPELAGQVPSTSIDGFGFVDGDANEDGELDIADAVYIMQTITAPDKYSLTAQGRFNADISGDGDGITLGDALAVQEILLGK